MFNVTHMVSIPGVPLFQCGGYIVIPLQPGLVTAWWPWMGKTSLKMIGPLPQRRQEMLSWKSILIC